MTKEEMRDEIRFLNCNLNALKKERRTLSKAWKGIKEFDLFVYYPESLCVFCGMVIPMEPHSRTCKVRAIEDILGDDACSRK